jgi:ABC-type uncharacterized transport system involved in gliding motility auxiliary subunit
VGDLRDLLKEYERQGGGKFKYTLIEPKTDEQREAAKEAGVQEQPFGEASAKGDAAAAITQGFLGLVFKYGSEKAAIPALHPARGDGLEFFITNTIREIRDKNDNIKRKIGVVTGKDELKLSDSNLAPRQNGQRVQTIEQVLRGAFPFYDITSVDLGGGQNAIDNSLVGLMLTQPGTDYTEKELRRIDEFLMLGGKSLAVIASAVSIKPNNANMSAELNLHGLGPLLEGYGIEMKKDAVLDHGAQVRIPIRVGMGSMVWVRHPGIAHVINDPRFGEEDKLLDTSFPSFFRMNDIMFPFPSSLILHKDKQPADVKVRAVARTTPAANSITTDTVDMSVKKDEWEAKDPFEQRVIAAMAEGKLKSAFAGKPGEGVTAPELAASSSRVLVISSSQFITNPFAYAGNGPEMPQGHQMQMMGNMGDEELLRIALPYTQYLNPTLLVVKNTFDWMSGDADLIAVSAKILGEANLTYSSVKKPEFKQNDSEDEMRKKDEDFRMAREDLQWKVEWTLVLGVPAVFGLVGLLRWRRRETLRTARA